MNAEQCPPWCTADHTSDDPFRIHQSKSTAIKAFQAGLGYRPAVHVGLGRVDEPGRPGKTVITVKLLASGDTLRLPPNDANVLADILDALEPDSPGPTDRLSIALSEAADLAALEQANRDQPNLTEEGER
ncbi:hypothetical protein AB0G05_26805 [Nonomuraea wenchangensis]